MISAKLEAKFVEALKSAIAQVAPGTAWRPVVRGMWREASEGWDGKELNPVGALIEVSVSPPAGAKFELNKATFDCTVTSHFKSASKVAATTTVLPTCDAIARLLFRWQMDRTALQEDLGFAGCEPFAAVTSGGLPPTLVETDGEWVVSQGLRVTAVIVM